MVQPLQVPRVDLSLLLHQDSQIKSLAVHQIHQACQNHGFFQIINHGICESVMKGALDVNSEFYDLPTAIKEELISDDISKPVRLRPFSKDRGESKGQFLRSSLKLYANPIEDFVAFWPLNPLNYRAMMGLYAQQVTQLANNIFGGIMESLGLSCTFMKQEFEQGMHMIGINSYPPSSESNMKMGIPPHTDYGLITILHFEKPGLHVMDIVNSSWTPVPDLQGSLLVLLGDQMEVLTNGAYKGVWHRAVPCGNETRISIASFLSFGMDEVAEPAMELVNEKFPKKYKGFSTRDSFEGFASGETKTFIETLKI